MDVWQEIVDIHTCAVKTASIPGTPDTPKKNVLRRGDDHLETSSLLPR
jgi:hypothetical protein